MYGFAHPRSGRTEWLLLPTVNLQVMSIALAHFARARGAHVTKRIVLVMDRAGWHRSPDLVVPEGVHLLFLPPYSPELQPSERLCPLSNEGIANQQFDTLDALEHAQAHRCRELVSQPEVIRAVTSFHWWPTHV